MQMGEDMNKETLKKVNSGSDVKKVAVIGAGVMGSGVVLSRYLLRKDFMFC